MLPNWLYGKSKSKLANILGGGGGAPADYNQVKAQVAQNKADIEQNTEDIDLLSDALDGKAGKAQITNPNILHNPWFQVNQRGETSVSVNGLFVDRWRVLKASAGSTTFTLNSDGTITIDNSLGEAHCYFIQRRTAKTIARVAGRMITASVMLSDGTVRSGSGTYDPAASTNYYEDDDIKLQSIAQSVGQFFILRVEAGKTITIKALKLELGSISTLAMDTAPDMATELLKCQRYYQKFNFSTGGPIGMGYASGGVAAEIVIPLMAPMRISGQIAGTTNGNENIVILNNGTEHAVSLLSTRVNECYCYLDITSSDLTPNQPCIAKPGTGAFTLEIAAEL